MMTKDKLAELQQQGLKAVGAARAIYDAAQAAGRQMSPSEQADYDRRWRPRRTGSSRSAPPATTWP